MQSHRRFTRGECVQRGIGWNDWSGGLIGFTSETVSLKDQRCFEYPGVLSAGLLSGTEMAYHHGHDDHRAKNYPHRCVWVPKVHVQTQGRERDDSVIKHVARDRNGPAGRLGIVVLVLSYPNCTLRLIEM